jgi:hypothetical protein
VVKDMEEELQVMIKERAEIEEKLNAAREALNEELRDYKENRNLGLQVGAVLGLGLRALLCCILQAMISGAAVSPVMQTGSCSADKLCCCAVCCRIGGSACRCG